MNKFIMSILTVFFLSFSLSSFAAPDLSSLHTNKQSANTNQNKMVRSASHTRTDIHVLNSSSQMITVKVVGTQINDNLYPQEVEDILSDVYFDAVEIVLYDEDGYEFFRDYVSNHATLEVKNIYSTRSAAGGKQHKVQAVIKK